MRRAPPPQRAVAVEDGEGERVGVDFPQQLAQLRVPPRVVRLAADGLIDLRVGQDSGGDVALADPGLDELQRDGSAVQVRSERPGV